MSKQSIFRTTVLVCVVAAIIALFTTVTSLVGQLRQLSTASTDNMQWTISQVDTELANLSSTIAQKLLRGSEYDSDLVRLRADIALSRLSMLHSGRVGQVYAGNEEAERLKLPIMAYYQELASRLDAAQELSPDDLRALLALTEELRPTVRRMAVLGAELTGARTQQRRQEFFQQVSLTGWLAVGAVVFMAGLLLILDQLYRRATERDKKLQASTRELASTVSASLDAIVTADQSGQIVGFNAAAEKVFGWSKSEIIGKTMQETLVPDRMRAAHLAGMERYLNEEAPKIVDGGRVEMPALRKNGEEFPVELNITSVDHDDGQRFIAYIRDISARKIAEQSLIDARDRAQRTDRAKSQFLTVMSHEMRTPLNGVLGVLDLLKTTRLTKRQGRYAELAAASSEILLQHVNEALDITRVETGSLLLSPQEFELEPLCAQITGVLTPLAQEKGLSLTLEIKEGAHGLFWGDSGRIRQILTNLIGNAIKFTDVGSIKVAVTGINAPGQTQLRFAISDTGRGIDPENQEQIFNDFVALGSGDERQFRGDGLGLSISSRIARQMGGDLKVESTLGRGTTFTFDLPVSRVRTSAGHTASHSDPETGSALPSQLSVLIVEDNSINRKILKDMLLGLGAKPCEAADGVEALRKAEMRMFDMIFMDISMPEMDGIETTQRLRSGAGPNAKTHIVGLTAHGEEEYRARAEASGMNSFYTKPIRLDLLRHILRDTKSVTPTIHPHDGFEELRQVLGPDKLAATSQQFFDELDQLCGDILNDKYSGNSDALSGTTHRVKGAAQLLGFETLAEQLSALYEATEAGQNSLIERRAARLASQSEEMRSQVARKLTPTVTRA
ncbi:MAG: ATP-binding protein [Pseudomonadota bacterium]